MIGEGTKTWRASPKSSLKRLGLVLNDLTSRLGLDKRLKEHTLISLWPGLVGEPWSSRSRGLFFDYEGTLVVAVSDAATGQELSFIKPKILKSLVPLGRALGLNVKGLRFDLKHFHDHANESVVHEKEDKILSVSEETLSNVLLDDFELRQVEELTKELNSAGMPYPISVSRIASLVERSLKLKQWQRLNGYPTCRSCGETTDRQYGQNGLCAPCYCQSL